MLFRSLPRAHRHVGRQTPGDRARLAHGPALEHPDFVLRPVVVQHGDDVLDRMVPGLDALDLAPHAVRHYDAVLHDDRLLHGPQDVAGLDDIAGLHAGLERPLLLAVNRGDVDLNKILNLQSISII